MEAADRPLDGRSILLTRPAGRAETLGRRLAFLGARVESRPVIALEPPRDRQAVTRALARLDRYDWIVFTSGNGVRFFLEALREAAVAPGGIRQRIAAIGPTTAGSLRSAGLSPSVVASESHSEGLARALETHVATGDRVLLVRPEVARATLIEALERRGVRCDPVSFYRNTSAAGVEELVREIGEGRFDVVVLASPSALEHLLQGGSGAKRDGAQALGRCRLVAIGSVTARAIERAGLAIGAVASQPSDDGIVEAVLSLDP